MYQRYLGELSVPGQNASSRGKVSCPKLVSPHSHDIMSVRFSPHLRTGFCGSSGCQTLSVPCFLHSRGPKHIDEMGPLFQASWEEPCPSVVESFERGKGTLFLATRISSGI